MPNLNILDIREVACAIGIPWTEWPGRCNEIALKMLDNGLVPAGTKNRYGKWWGPVTDRWFKWHPVLNSHGWLESKEGYIVDPTRWCFTGEEPYIYVGENDGSYDFGGDSLRRAMMKPFPDWCDSGEQGHHNCTDERVELTELFVADLRREASVSPFADFFEPDESIPIGQPNTDARTCQVFWLCNLPLSILSEVTDGKAVASYLARDFRGRMPADTQQWALDRDRAVGYKP